MIRFCIFFLLLPILLFSNPKLTNANNYLNVKDYENAVKLYNEVLSEDAVNVEALYGKGLSLLKLKKYEEAIKAFDQVLLINPAFKDTYYRKALSHRNSSDYDKAIDSYLKYLTQNPNDPDTFFGLAQTYVQKKDLVYSAYYYNVYIQKETRESEKKWVEKSKSSLDDILLILDDEQKKKYEELLNSKKETTVVETKTEETKATNVVVNQEKSAKDDSLSYVFEKGENADDLYLAKKYTEAIEAYKTFLANPVKRREGLFKTAITYATLEDYKNSVKFFTQIIIEETDNHKTKELLKILLSNSMVVQSLLSKEITIKNEIALKKGEELIKNGNYLEALDIFEILLDNIPGNFQALLYKVDILKIFGKNDKINESFGNYLSKNPNDSIINEKYGDFLLSQQKKEEANVYYQKVLSSSSNSVVINRIKNKVNK